MKVFMSADIEGISSTVSWEECMPNDPKYPKAAAQMTREVLAACDGAFAAGADEIFIKDAHGPGTNIDICQMPERVRLSRRWSEHPFSMVEGINDSFDAAIFVGYHSAAGKNGSILSHTMSRQPLYVKINDVYASEFLIYSYAAAYVGVPTVYLSGDRQLCQESAALHPCLITTPVKEGNAYAAICVPPVEAEKMIRRDVERALRQDLSGARITLPEEFVVEISYKEHVNSAKPSYYPGMKRKDPHTVVFQTKDYFEVLRMINFVL